MARGGSPTSKSSSQSGQGAKRIAQSVKNVKLQELSVISVQTAKRQAFISAELKVLSTERET